MNRLVVDSSVAVKWYEVEGERHREEALALVQRAAEETLELHAPILLVFELGNFFSRRARRAGADPRSAALEDLFAAPIRWSTPDLPLALRSLALAGDHRLSFHDASFVALAERLDALLVTADADLARPFPRTRVRLLGRDPLPV
ncbi:MAG: type II toxin-antitoxin system VapC family toxin [Planctomycetota bacterium]